jgi:hypothetical protein
MIDILARMRGVKMTFSTRVKSTGDFFQATTLWEPEDNRGRDVHGLAPGESYLGHLFTGTKMSPENGSLNVSFENYKSEVLTAGELELIYAEKIHLQRAYTKEG